MTTYVCYHIPSDRDDGDHPNAFSIDKPSHEISLKDIKRCFPLPGEYHFRFKVKMDGGSFWIDFNQDDELVPAWGPRRIVAKVLRLSWNTKTAPMATLPPTVPKANIQYEVPRHADLFGGNSPQPPREVNGGVTELDLFS
jgi:hypothetical protein